MTSTYEDASARALPLSGIRVLDATSNIAGPFSGAILADLGAEVIKIETPQGDPTRAMAPTDGDRSAYFHVVNRNKTSRSIDLKSPVDRATLDTMLDSCDVFLTNFLQARLEMLNLTAAEIMKTRPQLIFGNLSSYGGVGPNADTPGYDATIQARTGIMHITGETEGPPVRTGVSVLDIGSGMWLAIGVLAALVKRNETGLGSIVETSLFETGAMFVSYHVSAQQIHGRASVRSGSGHPTFAPYGLFSTSEGTLCVGVGNDNIFGKLCKLIGRADLISNPRYLTNSDRVAHSKELVAEIEGALLSDTAENWAHILGTGGVPADRLALPEDLHADPQSAAIQALLPYPDSTSPVLELPGLPLRFDGVRPPIRKPAPHLDSHR